jgi:type II secretion system protein L
LKNLGISIARNVISAVLWEHSLRSSKMEGSCEVPCTEPYGSAEDIARLAEEVRRIAGPGPLPSAVLSLPPSWTFLRPIRLPVTDLPRAKKMHIAELEGNLPIDDEEILSDILPAGEPGTFLAVAARRSAVEKVVSLFTEAGFRPDRAITDHVSLLCAVLSSKKGFSGLVFSDRSDFVALRLSGGAVAAARQFPEAIAATPGELVNGIREILEADAHGASPQASIVVGDLPPPLAELLPHPVPFVAPGAAGNASLLAFGAALAPLFRRETGNFSLRTSAEAETERARNLSRVRIAAALGLIALISLVGTILVAQWAEGKKVSQIRAQIRKEFTEAVPGVKVVQETAQIREKIQALARQRKELGSDFPEPAALLAKVSQALPANQNVSVREVSFDSGRLRLQGDAGSAELVETFRTSLVAAFGPDTMVTVQESGGSVRGGNVRYTILIEKGGNGRVS